MKRKISLILLISLLMSSLFAFGVSATENTVTFSNGLDKGISWTHSYESEGTTKTHKAISVATGSTANTWLEGSGALQIATMANTIIEGHSNLFTFGEEAVIPVGTYTVSIWVRHNTASSTDWYNKKSDAIPEIALMLYGIGVTDDSAAKDNGVMIKLFENNGYNGYKFVADASTETTRDGATKPKPWQQYSAEITLTEPCSSAAFWILHDGSTPNTKEWYAYVDDLEITGTPEVQEKDIQFRGVQESAPDTTANTFNVRLISTLNSLDFANVGYEVTVKTQTQGTWKTTVTGNEVYETVSGTAEGVNLDYKASYYNTKYICALTIQNLPSDEEITVTFKPFAGSSNDVQYAAVYKNGAFQSCGEVQ